MPSPLDPAQTEIARLVRVAQRGDRAAFADLYQRFSRMVHGIVLARVARAGNGDVDDVVQDVFVTALERLNDLREPAAFGEWIAAIARHRAADHGRRMAITVGLEDDVATTRDPDHLQAMAILDTVRSLPDAYRETLILRLVEGMSGAEIADRTGLTAASVRVNLHRGMKLLREKLT